MGLPVAPDQEEVNDFRTCKDCGLHAPKEAFCRSKQKDRNGKHYIVYRNRCRQCWSKYLLQRRAQPGMREKDVARQRSYNRERQARAKWKVVDPDGRVTFYQVERCARKRAATTGGTVVPLNPNLRRS